MHFLSYWSYWSLYNLKMNGLRTWIALFIYREGTGVLDRKMIKHLFDCFSYKNRIEISLINCFINCFILLDIHTCTSVYPQFYNERSSQCMVKIGVKTRYPGHYVHHAIILFRFYLLLIYLFNIFFGCLFCFVFISK